MKRRALFLIPLAPFGAALAQDRRPLEQRSDPSDPHVPYGRDGREIRFDRGTWQGRDEGEGRAERERAWRREASRGRHYRARTPPRYARGAGPHQDYYPGGRLPDEYRLRHYVVGDWRDQGLTAPPRGYHWVEVAGDFLLVAIASGIVMELVLPD